MKRSIVVVAVLLAINLQSTEAACQIVNPPSATNAAGATAYTTFTGGSPGGLAGSIGGNIACTAACALCDQTEGADTSASGTISTAAGIIAIGQSICPTITFTSTTTAQATNFPLPAYTADVTGAVQVTNVVAITPAAAYAAALPGDNNAQLCPCLTANTNTCHVCGCADYGIPTLAPTSSPTTAPSATHEPTTDGYTIDLTDDSLSAVTSQG